MQKLSSPVELIKQSLHLFFDRVNLLYFLKIYALLLPFSILIFIQDMYLKSQIKNLNLSDPGLFFGQNPWFVWTYLIVGIAFVLVSFWISASGIIAVNNVVGGGRPDVKQVFAEAWKKLLPFSLLVIILGLLTTLGFILLLVPGILVLVWFNFASFELISKGVGVKEAMANSKRLVAGKFWMVLGRIVVFGLFMLLVQIVFSILPYNIGSVISPLFGALLVLPYFLLYKELSV